MKNLLKMLTYIREEYRRLIAITLLSLVLAAISAIQPQIFKNVVDALIESTTQNVKVEYAPLFLQLGVLSLIYVVSSHAFNLYADRVYFSVQAILSKRVYGQITSLSLDYFEIHRPGAIIRKATASINNFVGWINHLTYNFLGPIFTLLFVEFVLIRMNIFLGIIGLATILLTYYEISKTRKKARPLQKQFIKQSESSWGIFNESISNMSTVVTAARIDRFRNDFDKYQDEIFNTNVRLRNYWNYSIFRRSIFNESMYLLAIGVSVWLAIQGQASAGDLLAITAYFAMIRSNISGFARFFPLTEEAEQEASRLIEMLETKPTISDNEAAIPLKRLDSIEFKNVSFTYPDGKKGAISDISFRIDGSKSIALVGPSGVGKSTITKLVLRFYEPSGGQILINDVPVETYTIDSIREHIGMVMQDVALFNTTVGKNLKMANPSATKKQLQQAAAQSHAAEFIDNLPKQYNTLVGERGVKLSGGQKQRLAIARAILKDPQLIILDEATSALDSESERLVQDGLIKLREGRSSLTIAHRLSTVQHADEILVLKNGKIHERGKHGELIRKRGLYHRLFSLQSATGEIKL